MKKLLIITTLFVLFSGCNKNENKEARIRKLEAEIQQATDRLQELENRVQKLESLTGKTKTETLENIEMYRA